MASNSILNFDFSGAASPEPSSALDDCDWDVKLEAVAGLLKANSEPYDEHKNNCLDYVVAILNFLKSNKPAVTKRNIALTFRSTFEQLEAHLC